MTARITGNEAALKASTEMHALKRIGTLPPCAATLPSSLSTSADNAHALCPPRIGCV
jgi:hypothetical protein